MATPAHKVNIDVKNTAVTFEYDTPSLGKFKMRMERIKQLYPYLVILKDGHIAGYAYVCVSYPESGDEYLKANSTDFHVHPGFVKVGEFHKYGYKFGRWYNMIWMGKIIGEHEMKSQSVTYYPGLYAVRN